MIRTEVQNGNPHRGLHSRRSVDPNPSERWARYPLRVVSRRRRRDLRHAPRRIRCTTPRAHGRREKSNNPAWSFDGKKIAFVSNRDFAETAPWGENAELYEMGPDGSNVQRITSNNVFDTHPKWSPDGKSIAFHSFRDGNWDVFIVRSDGSNERRFTDHPGRDQCPNWSPDGARLIFGSNRADGEHVEIYVADAEGENVQRLTYTPEGVQPCTSWSPDDQWIAFHAFHDGASDVFVMRSDGSEIRQLTETSGDMRGCGTPDWSPDGKRLVFHCNRDGESDQPDLETSTDMEIYTVNADGSDLLRLTSNRIYDGHPAW